MNHRWDDIEEMNAVKALNMINWLIHEGEEEARRQLGK